MPMPARLIIHAIDCKVHSTGVDAGPLEALRDALASVPKIFPGVSEALQGASAAINLIVDVAVALDQAGDYPDQLYLNLSNDPGVHKVWPTSGDYSNVRSGQIVRPNLIIPFSSAVDVNFWEYDSGSADDFLGRLSVDMSHVGNVRYQVIARPSEGAIYVVVYSVENVSVAPAPASGDLLWYKHHGWQNGAGSWDGPVKVGNSWGAFKLVLATSDGVIYGIQPDGKLLWYRHTDYLNGIAAFSGASQVGTDWQGFKHVFATSEGVIYGIKPDGKLLCYRHRTYLNGTGQIGVSEQVGTGWQNFKFVFATSNGVIYAVTTDGKLLWYRHKGYLNGTGSIEGPKEVSTGWGHLKSVFASRNGVIYGMQTTGALFWYYHQGWTTGAGGWAGQVQVGSGWQGFKSAFATSNGILYGINS